MRKFLFLGVVAVGLARAANAPPQPPDGRWLNLQAFFESYHCPAPYHVEDYLREADKNAIDYRLLPAISVRESTCGRHGRLNNHWGWDSARSGFASVKAGIRYLARKLALGESYKDKTVDGKLKIYNPKLQYAVEVRHLMDEIGHFGFLCKELQDADIKGVALQEGATRRDSGTGTGCESTGGPTSLLLFSRQLYP